MRIGINLLYLLPGIVGGTETYAKCLLEELARIGDPDRFIVFVNRESENWPLPDGFERVVCPVRAVSRFARYLFEQFRLPGLLSKHRIDLVHSPGYVTPFFPGRPSVVSILDIVYEYPGAFNAAKKQLLKFLVWGSARRADHVITISEASRREIVARLNVPREAVTVSLLAYKPRPAGSASDWDRLKATLRLNGGYLLAFSSMSPSKNIPMLLSAYARLREDGSRREQLVLVGHPPKRGVRLSERVESLGLGESVTFTGYLSDEQLSLLLQHAAAFVFPSLYEGFGIPVLEAMAAGVPVACSRVASLPEVAGEAALFFDPTDLQDMTRALARLLDDRTLRERLVVEGRRNVERFSWAHTARTTLDVYRKVGSGTHATR